jgi:hypothetical protein
LTFETLAEYSSYHLRTLGGRLLPSRDPHNLALDAAFEPTFCAALA